jgi:hypothetical protein
MKSDFGLDEFMEVIPLLARIIQSGGDTEASSKLQEILDGLKHWRRVKAPADSEAIPVDESG